MLTSAALAQTTIPVGPGQTYTTIQAGINAANPGDTVLVAPGTYVENIDFKGKAITVTSSGGAASTIIDGDNKAPAATFQSGETAAAVLSGFTIQHGGSLANGIGSIHLYNSTPTIRNNTITQGNCWGIESDYSAPLIENNTISATQDPHGTCSFGGGAAIIIWGGINSQYNANAVNSGILSGNIIENNVESGLEDAGGNGGAGVAIWGGRPIIVNNIIRNNASPGGSGGAINVVNSRGTVIAQNLIYGNSAGCGGGAIATDSLGMYVINNTIVDNVGVGTAGFSECANIAQIYPSPDRYGYDDPSDVFVNNIISGSSSYPAVNCSWYSAPSEANQPTFENNILYNAGGPFFGSYCVDVSGEYNNIAADPQFVNPAAGDYHLKSTSPAIDTGLNSALQTFLSMAGQGLPTDFDRKPRVQDATGKGCVVDMGAYEYPGSVSNCAVSETLTSSLNPALAGQSVTFTAQLSASSGTPTGTVQFLDGATLLATQTVSATGSAAFTSSSLAVGSHTITANYLPTGSFGATTASLVEVINGYLTTTALTCLPNPINIYSTAQLTATVTASSGTPTGSVSFTDNGALMGRPALAGGAATLTYTGSVAETHTIIATYVPSGSFAASSATCSEVVNALPTISTLSAAPATSTYGSPVTLTATVAAANPPGPSTPTGVVTFYKGASALGTGTLVNGVATLVEGSLPGGSYNLTCMYSGSSIYATSNCSPVPVVINAAPTALALSSSSNPAPYPSPVTFTAHLSVNGQPAGAGNSIHLAVNGQSIALTTDGSGSATYTLATLSPGTYPVNASFAATTNLLASAASLTQIITTAPTSTSLSGSPNPGDLNQQVTLTATILSQSTAVSGGSVTFFDGPTALSSSPLSASGTATFAATFTSLGVHPLTAVYNGDADFSASTSAVFNETIVAGDFSIDATPGTAEIYTGQAAKVQVSLSSLHGFNQAVTLTCSGLPANATCSFTPSTLPNGQGAANLVIQTAAPQKVAVASISLLGLLTLLLLPDLSRRSSLLARLSAIAVCALALGLGMSGCGGVSSIAGGSPPGTYQVAVTASTTGGTPPLSHSAVVTLTVKSLF